MKSKGVKLKVANTEFTIGDILQVTPKLDKDAPDGFQKFNTTKLLMEGIEENLSVTFDEELGMWDTGFDVIHKSLSRLPAKEKEARVQSYIKHIKEPYEARFKKELDSNNDEFWKSFLYPVYTDRKIDTKNPKELLELFFMLKDGAVCEEGEKDYYLRRASYNIKNVKEAISLEEQRRNTKFEAMSVFGTLLDQTDDDDDTLYTILEWINVHGVRGADKNTLRTTVLKHLDNESKGYDNSKRFLKAYEMSKSNTEKEIMENFSVLQKLSQNKKIDYRRKVYSIDGHTLGSNLKEAAERITKDKDLFDLVEEKYQELINK